MTLVAEEMIVERTDRVLTQYRESPRLLGVIRALLQQVAEAAIATEAVPTFFDIDTATGEQLTLIGKRLGFPRCHCVENLPPVFGFDCGAGPYEITGFCDAGAFLACRETGVSTVCLDNDEIYRGMLKARRYQALGLYDVDSLTAAAQCIWGETANVYNLGGGRVVVSEGRALYDAEAEVKEIAFRALPIAPGVQVLTTPACSAVFGLGTGWGGFCDASEWLCPTEDLSVTCATLGTEIAALEADGGFVVMGETGSEMLYVRASGDSVLLTMDDGAVVSETGDTVTIEIAD